MFPFRFMFLGFYQTFMTESFAKELAAIRKTSEKLFVTLEIHHSQLEGRETEGGVKMSP